MGHFPGLLPLLSSLTCTLKNVFGWSERKAAMGDSETGFRALCGRFKP